MGEARETLVESNSKAVLGKEPLWIRVLLVLGGMSPLFILWAIRGSPLIQDKYFVSGCLIAFTVSNAYIPVLIVATKRAKVPRRVTVDRVDDRRSDVLAYLFAMMLPFYTVSLESWRDVTASAVAFMFVLCLFVGLRLHFLNFWLIVFGFHCYSTTTLRSEFSDVKTAELIILTRNGGLSQGDVVKGWSVTPNFVLEL